MTKEEIQKKVLTGGNPLDLRLFTWDSETKTFSSLQNGLVIDFTLIDGVTFELGSYCMVKMGSFCKVKSGPSCVFVAGHDCFFETGGGCTFITNDSCAFKVGPLCVVVKRVLKSGAHFYEVIEPRAGQRIRLKYGDFKGFDIFK